MSFYNLSRVTRLVFVPLSALALSSSFFACAHAQPDSPDADGRRSAEARFCRTLEVDHPFDPEEACPRWRYVATTPDDSGECPGPASPGDGLRWQTSPLFSAVEGAPVPPHLKPFCVYEIVPANGTPGTPNDGGEPIEVRRLEEARERLEELVEAGQLRDFDSDCMALRPTAELSKNLWRDLEWRFAAGAGRPADLGAALGVSGEKRPAKPRSRLVFLDTQPFGEHDQGRSRHGFGLGHMARSLLCAPAYGGNTASAQQPTPQNLCVEKDEDRCLARVEHRLAMSMVQFDRDFPLVELDPGFPVGAPLPPGTFSDPHHGGYFGSLCELGSGIWNAVAEWKAAAEEERLVLNLSLGWHGHLFGGDESRVDQMPVQVQAVYHALEVAACHGVLTTAAAGNRAGGPQDGSGPLLPAGWEEREAPGRKRCAKILGPTSRSVDLRQAAVRAEDEPLVYAAGGVRAGNGELANARPESTPPRVAFADHAVAGVGCNGEATAVLTGTSVASAVVSTSAAGVWSVRPELSRREVMELLERSGPAVGREADFRHPGWSKKVRRVVFCRALAKACSGSHCPGWSGECTDFGNSGGALSQMGTSLSGYVDKPAPQSRSPLDAPLCGAKELIADGSIPVAPCPSDQFHGVSLLAWTGPQPPDTPCPSCTIPPPPQSLAFPPPGGPTTELYIEIEGWAGGELAGAMLKVGDILIALDLPPLSEGSFYRITGLDANLFAGNPPPPVSLVFNTPDGSVEVPVLVVQSATPF